MWQQYLLIEECELSQKLILFTGNIIQLIRLTIFSYTSGA